MADVKTRVLNGVLRADGPRRGDGTVVRRPLMGGGRTDPSRSPNRSRPLVLALENRSRTLTSGTCVTTR
jgi:hypothetical protein